MIDFRPDGAAEREDFGAFVPGPRLMLAGAASGPLVGLTFAAKDLFDIEGHVTGCGSPDWALSHPPALRSATVVNTLLAAGASLVGKTVTDEISLGLLGRNRHVGAPVNPRASGRYPGGSSSGSAVAVAAALASIALGTDSGGSMRVPASFCGIFGIRPTHGAVPVEGMMVQAPSFDTAGFFAADAEMFARVGEVLLPPAPVKRIEEVLIVEDAFALVDDVIRQALEAGVARVAGFVGRHKAITLVPEGLETWNRQHVHLQQPEFGATFAPWVDAVDPRLSYDVAAAISIGRGMAGATLKAARAFRAEIRSQLDGLLEDRRILCLPTTPMLPPPRDISLKDTAEAGHRLVNLTCIAGLTGLPQVSLPLGEAEGLPVGLSLIGWRGGDRTLLDFARHLCRPAA